MPTTTDTVGKYAIVQEIAHGGFGRTLLAENPDGKRVVLKQFNPQQHNIGSQALRLFDQECDLLQKIGHHGQIPSFIEYFEEGDDRFIAQEWIPGITLKEELDQSGTFNEQQIIDLLLDILPVVQFVHQNKVIHRDIKPENIIRRSSDGKLVLVDFGASKPLETTIVAETGTSIGSVKFVSPEQARGKATYASDIYSLGLTCAHLLTYASPFEFEDVETGTLVWRDYCTQPVTEGLGLVIDKMLERGLKNRYSKASQVLEAIEEIERRVSVAHNESAAIQDYLEDNSARLSKWREQVSQNAKKYELYSEEKKRQLLIDHIRAHHFLPLFSAEQILEDGERFKGEKFDAVAILSGRQYLVKTRNLETSLDTITYKWGPEWLGKPEDDNSGSLAKPLYNLIAPFLVLLMTGVVAKFALNGTHVQQDSPPVAIEQPSQKPEDEGGLSLPRFPVLDDVRDTIVADELMPKELTQGLDVIVVLVKVGIVLMVLTTGVGVAIRVQTGFSRN